MCARLAEFHSFEGGPQNAVSAFIGDLQEAQEVSSSL